MELGLEGKSAVITGASKGIGLATAAALAREGCNVALSARDEAVLEQAKAEVSSQGSGNIVAMAIDLSTSENMDRFVDFAVNELGAVDILVNAAGSAPPGSVDTLTEENWDLALNLKLRGFIRATRAVLPHMKAQGHGRIVNIAGTAGKQPDSWMLTSGTVNAAVLSLTRAVASQVAGDGITVNAVCPGPTGTQRWAGLKGFYSSMKGLDAEDAESAILESIPMGRIAAPEEIADLVTFLASARAEYITGVSIEIDGGATKGI